MHARIIVGGHRSGMAVCSYGGMIWIAVGLQLNASHELSNQFQCYNAIDRIWTTLPPLPMATHGGRMVVLPCIDEAGAPSVYMMGGKHVRWGEHTTSIFRYSLSKQCWYHCSCDQYGTDQLFALLLMRLHAVCVGTIDRPLVADSNPRVHTERNVITAKHCWSLPTRLAYFTMIVHPLSSDAARASHACVGSDATATWQLIILGGDVHDDRGVLGRGIADERVWFIPISSRVRMITSHWQSLVSLPYGIMMTSGVSIP